MATQVLERPINTPATGAFARIVDRIPPMPARSKPHGPLTAWRLRRMAETGEIAEAVLFLASRWASIVTGQVLQAISGRHMA